ncbi:unnamed protein product, partial [Phaeothamnion confervicola]
MFFGQLQTNVSQQSRCRRRRRHHGAPTFREFAFAFFLVLRLGGSSAPERAVAAAVDPEEASQGAAAAGYPRDTLRAYNGDAGDVRVSVSGGAVAAAWGGSPRPQQQRWRRRERRGDGDGDDDGEEEPTGEERLCAHVDGRLGQLLRGAVTDSCKKEIADAFTTYMMAILKEDPLPFETEIFKSQCPPDSAITPPSAAL